MAAAAFCLLAGTIGCDRREPAPAAPADVPAARAPAAAKTAPQRDTPRLRVTTLDGGTFDLAEHRGRWVVVNFWATWCKPCIKEMPELSALDAMREHIDVVGLAYEEIDAEAMRAFLKKVPVVYPIAILDVTQPPEDFDTPRGLPMTYLLAPDGRIAKSFLGPVTAKDIEAAIAGAGGPAVR
ncbi:MAG TPA: TlpA disulfide reductase family protein [Lysobacter sp.]|nr:TlpA disulfide reductase family protein [Lysobacter sp.]